MTVLLIVVAVLIVLAIALPIVVARRNRADAPTVAEPGSAATGLSTNRAAGSPDGWSDVDGVPQGGADAAGPPSAIHMAVTGTHPWAPTRMFVAELKAEGYETTVELPDLVVLRDGDRRPVTVREPAGPPGHLVVTTAPELMAGTLETLVRSLLADAFSVDATDGRDVHLTDGDGTQIRLTVSDLALA